MSNMKTISLDLAEARLLVEYRINRVPSPDLIKVIDRLEMFVDSNIPSPAGVVPEKEFTPTEIKGGVPKNSHRMDYCPDISRPWASGGAQ